MESKAKFLGHPIHPMLIVFPLGLLATSFAFDIAYLISQNNEFATVSFWMISAGICGALLAAIFGTVDWFEIPAGTRAKSVGAWHGIGNLAVTILFIVSWFQRQPAPDQPPGSAIVLSLIGVLLALVTGWLGGELVDRLGVGVSDGAHLNSPSSLSGHPASEHPIEAPGRPRQV